MKRQAASVDPITVEVIGSRPVLDRRRKWVRRWSAPATRRTSRSGGTAPPPCSTLDGKTLCQAEHIPMHLGSFLGMVPLITQAPLPGGGDPARRRVHRQRRLRGRRHAPARHRAGRAHLLRGRDRWPGRSTPPTTRTLADRGHAHIFQEGIRIPPIRLYRAAVLQTGRAGPDPAELPGPAGAAVRPAGADGGQPARRAADAGPVHPATRRATWCWRRGMR